MDFFDNIDAGWAWLGLGFALAVLEMVVPGVYLLWLAIAALLTGVLTLTTDPDLWLQVVYFGVAAIISVYGARRWLKDHEQDSQDPLLNDKAGRLIGETAIITHPIASGEGRAKLGDSEWIARGPDMAEGSHVRVVTVKGPILFVEPHGAIAGDGAVVERGAATSGASEG